MAKKQEEPARMDPKSGVPICQYCGANMRCQRGPRFGVKYYACEEKECGRGSIKLGRPVVQHDNEGFSARP